MHVNSMSRSRHNFRSIFPAGLLCMCVLLASCASVPDASRIAQARPQLQVNVPQLHGPRAGLMTGGQPEASAWSGLAASGVTTVINLRTPAEMGDRNERVEVAGAGMAYHELPVDGAAGITRENARILQSLLTDAKAGGQGVVVVHCASGNRVGALLALGAIDAGMSPEQAIAFGREAGMTSAEARVRAVLAEGATP